MEVTQNEIFLQKLTKATKGESSSKYLRFTQQTFSTFLLCAVVPHCVA